LTLLRQRPPAPPLRSQIPIPFFLLAIEITLNTTSPTNGAPSPWLTTEEAATHLRLGKRTLEGYRSKGGGPTYYRQLGKLVFYSREDLDAWRQQGRALHTAQERIEGRLVA
jgi:hypothetical protein